MLIINATVDLRLKPLLPVIPEDLRWAIFKATECCTNNDQTLAQEAMWQPFSLKNPAERNLVWLTA